MTGPSAALNTEFLNRLRTFIRRRVRTEHDADDVVQDVLAKLLEHDASINAETVHAWLFTVARRSIIDRARTRKGDHAQAEDAEDPSSEDASGGAGSELARCMEPMLASLNEDDRSLLQRIDMLGESQAEVARELGLSHTALKSRVQRARARLRSVLEDCCAVERDRRGQPADYRRRADRPCPCDGCG